MADGERLTSGAYRLAQAALERQALLGHAQLGVNHWLLALMERYGPLAASMAVGLESAALVSYLRGELAQGQPGEPLSREEVIAQTAAHAAARGHQTPDERDMAAVILVAAGYALTDEETPALTTSGALAAPGSALVPFDEAASGLVPWQEGAYESHWLPRVRRPLPALERYGRDLTRAALAGKLAPFVGREEEVRLVIETLCRRTKRNPALVGPAGVGKTAIVEGLAQRIVQGDVPEMLQGARVLALQPSALIAGAAHGELEQRLERVLTEASDDGILLFIDEIHSIVGAGGTPGVGDLASLLKPALARGDIACIAATTDDEYRRFIESDGALERRFQPLRVQELSPAQTLTILEMLRTDLAQARGVTVAEPILHRIIAFAEQHLRSRHFPDKAVDLLEQCVAHALAEGKPSVELHDAETVMQRLIGMPLSLASRVEGLRAGLERRRLLTPEEGVALQHRLEVTLAGFDLRPIRPNAVVLLAEHAAENARALAELLAETLYGGADRVVTLDFSRFTEQHHVSMLIGSPPGYIGFSGALPIHQIGQMPWCVLLCENLPACHPSVRDVLKQALSTGVLTDACGKNLYLSDAIVLLTAPLAAKQTRSIGLVRRQEAHIEEIEEALESLLTPEFMEQCDLICTGTPDTRAADRDRLQTSLIAGLAERYAGYGLELQWDEAVIDWLCSHPHTHHTQREWERWADEHLGSLLVPYLMQAGEESPLRLQVRMENDQLQVGPTRPNDPSVTEDAM
jgi:ATP-dependent Clp protease ATP-binding subunit ClpC